MGYYKKIDIMNFEMQPFEGLYFLDGAMLKRLHNLPESYRTHEQKFPRIAFPSGHYDIWETSKHRTVPTVHIAGEQDYRLDMKLDEAYQHGAYVAEQCGDFVYKDNGTLIVVVPYEGKYRIHFGEEGICDIERIENS